MFNANSSLVKLYVRKIHEKEIALVDVPSLFNLREEVEKLTTQ